MVKMVDDTSLLIFCWLYAGKIDTMRREKLQSIRFILEFFGLSFELREFDRKLDTIRLHSCFDLP